MTDTQPTDEPTTLDQIIDQVLSELEGAAADSPEFARMVEQLAKLYEMKPKKESSKISKEAVLSAAVNIGGILAILYFEKAGVVTSKALGFVRKLV